jgi:hypothetical protein
MSLSSSEHRRLAAIAENLTRDDPALAALLAGFASSPLPRGARLRAEPATWWRRIVGHGVVPVLLFAIAPLFIALGHAVGIPAFLIAGCALTNDTPLLAVLWATRFWSGRPVFG